MYKEKWTDGQPETAEYYLMDASGHTLALRKTDLVQNTHSWEYYVYGNEREARLTPSEGQSPGNNSSNMAVRIVETNVQFYLYDHLGNTRVTYSPRVADVPNQSFYNNIDYVIDYFPYGKMLREFVPDLPERYLTTQHERDRETGLDYRGARYYDSDVARFLSIDPWANKYPAWSTYNYVMGNPIILIDPTGKGPGDLFKSQNEAAVDWSKNYAAKSIRKNREYASPIYTVTINGVTYYSYSKAKKGNKYGSKVGPVPEGATKVADIHSHGAYDSDLDNTDGHDSRAANTDANNEFSGQDILTNHDEQINGYVTTPNGSLLYHNWSGGTQDFRNPVINIIAESLPSDPNDSGQKNSYSAFDQNTYTLKTFITKDQQQMLQMQNVQNLLNLVSKML